MTATVTLKNVDWNTGTATCVLDSEAKSLLGFSPIVHSIGYDNVQALLAFIHGCLNLGIAVREVA